MLETQLTVCNLNLEKKYDAVIVGAGLSGIACALHLNKKGKQVLVVEKNDTPGGKLAEFKSKGFRFDQGPSLLTEPENIIEIFKAYNKAPEDYISIIKHNESCRYYFPDGMSFLMLS